MAPASKLIARLAAGKGELLAQQLAVNRIFRENQTTEGAPIPRHIIAVEDVTHGLGLDSADEQAVQQIILDTNAHFDQTTQTHRMTLARASFVTTLRAMPHISSDIRMELTKRVIAYWRRNTQTDYGKPPTIRTITVKSEPTLTIGAGFRKAGAYIGPRGGKWADAKHTIPWKDPVLERKRGLLVQIERSLTAATRSASRSLDSRDDDAMRAAGHDVRKVRERLSRVAGEHEIHAKSPGSLGKQYRTLEKRIAGLEAELRSTPSKEMEALATKTIRQ